MKKIMLIMLIICAIFVLSACDKPLIEPGFIEPSGEVLTKQEDIWQDIFTDNICLAVAYITDENETEFMEKYFNKDSKYKLLQIYDLSNEFVGATAKIAIIPKDENVFVAIDSCVIDEEGNLAKEYEVYEKTNKPFLLKYDNYEPTMPQYLMELKVADFEALIPIVFSGMDGHLDLSGNESEVKDISIYEDV